MPGGAGLSGGEKARVSLARVLAAAELDQEHDRRQGHSMLLLFDEPTASLDHESSALFWQALKRALSLHPWLAAVVITHHVSDLQHCNRHYVFDGGKVNEGK
jgi:ABC-type transport system involved in cytochrome bd biosynthesis fused ATPase/permease subunit